MTLEELADKAHAVLETYPVKIPDSQKDDWYFLKFQEELGELTQAYLRVTARARTKGESEDVLRRKFSEELADVLGFVLAIAKRHEIPLEKTFREKWLSLLERSTPKNAAL